MSTHDGTGLAISLTTSVNGAATTVANVAGVYTVNTDCTGSKTFPTGHFNFVISPDGNTLTWIVTDSGITMSGTAVRQRHTD